MTFYVLTATSSVKDGIKLTLSPADGAEGEAQTLLLTEKSYRKLGAPVKGTILSDTDAEPYRQAHRRYAAVRRALSILSASDNSEAMLYRKLRARGFLGEDARFAVAYAKKNGLIRESEQLARLVSKLANEKLYGRTRVLHALSEKGYRTSDIQNALDACVRAGELDFSKNLRALYEKKKPKDESERKKLAYRYGYLAWNED